MRVLVDEHLPVRFARELARQLAGGSTCTHAVRAGFGGFANGDLQDSAVAANYDVLVTSDLNMPFQPRPRLPILVIAATNDIQVAFAHVLGVVDLLHKPSLVDPLPHNPTARRDAWPQHRRAAGSNRRRPTRPSHRTRPRHRPPSLARI